MTEHRLLSRNEALAVLEEFGVPKGGSSRDVLAWLVEHQDTLPYTPTELVLALFPGNPQNIRDTLSDPGESDRP